MKSLKVQFIAVFAAFIFLSCAVISLMSAFSMIRTGEDFAAKQGVPVVQKAASMIDGNKFEQLSRDMMSSEWSEELRLSLLDLKRSVGCEYLYTMVQSGDKFVYVVDGSCDPTDTENYSPMGSEEDVSSWGDAPRIALKTGETTSSGLEKQEGWGWMISTYKGIRNSSGRIVGFVACDFSVEETIATMRARIVKTSLVGVLAVVAGALILLLFSNRIFGTMGEISSAMERISNGEADLTQRIPVNGRNEISVLAESCNKVIGRLSELVSALKGSTGILGDTSRDLSIRMAEHISNIDAASQSISGIGGKVAMQRTRVESVAEGFRAVGDEIRNLDRRIDDQTAAISQSSSAIEQISANIQSVSRTVDRITEEYASLVLQSREGERMVQSVSEQIEEISTQSENLTEANSAIAAIAEQTNLLAMNAAIEAAHAGELGKGFSVVADEIRALAETSATQSGEIRELLDGISVAIKEIVESSRKSAEAFNSVGGRIGRMDGMMKEVKAGMDEETVGVDNILQTMELLDGATAEMTDASRKMKDESDRVFSAVDDLNSLASETEREASGVSSSMEQMRTAATEASEASEVSLEAAMNVVKMVNGFRV